MSVFSAILGVPVDAAYHAVSAFAHVLTPPLGGLAAATAIVLFTMTIRLLVLPLSYRSMRGLDAQARIAPKARALQAKHAKHPERLQRELAALYQAEGASMYAGCLPLLLQWPFLSVMYLLFRSPTIDGARNSLLTHDLFGAALGSHWLGNPGPFSAQGAVFAGLFALLAAGAWLSTRLTQRLTQAGALVPAPSAAKQGSQAPAALAKLIPFITVVTAAFVPLAAGLYLATTTAWTLAERTLLRRRADQPS